MSRKHKSSFESWIVIIIDDNGADYDLDVDKDNLSLMRDNRSMCRNNTKPLISTDIGNKPIRGGA